MKIFYVGKFYKNHHEKIKMGNILNHVIMSSKTYLCWEILSLLEVQPHSHIILSNLSLVLILSLFTSRYSFAFSLSISLLSSL